MNHLYNFPPLKFFIIPFSIVIVVAVMIGFFMGKGATIPTPPTENRPPNPTGKHVSSDSTDLRVELTTDIIQKNEAVSEPIKVTVTNISSQPFFLYEGCAAPDILNIEKLTNGIWTQIEVEPRAMCMMIPTESELTPQESTIAVPFAIYDSYNLTEGTYRFAVRLAQNKEQLSTFTTNPPVAYSASFTVYIVPSTPQEALSICKKYQNSTITGYEYPEFHCIDRFAAWYASVDYRKAAALCARNKNAVTDCLSATAKAALHKNPELAKNLCIEQGSIHGNFYKEDCISGMIADMNEQERTLLCPVIDENEYSKNLCWRGGVEDPRDGQQSPGGPASNDSEIMP